MGDTDPSLEVATLAGGCFWCMLPPFDRAAGVVSTRVGYTGGHTPNPSYDEVSTGTTGHLEAVEIVFDPKRIGYAQLLEVYKESVRESVASGFVSRGDVQRLESLRNQLQIRPGDHEKIMADLAEEERARFTDPALQVSAEKLLQLDSYSRALKTYLERVSQGTTAPDDAFIRHLRQEYAVTPEEHGAVLNQLLGKGEGLAPHVAKAFEAIESIQHTIALVRATPTSAAAAPVFIGIARAGAASRYLAGVAHVTVRGAPGTSGWYTEQGGTAPAVRPSRAFIWDARATGPGTQTVVWRVRSGEWMVIAMNADGSRPVSVRVNVAATLPALPWIAGGLLAGGVVALAAGVILLVIPIRRASRQEPVGR